MSPVQRRITGLSKLLDELRKLGQLREMVRRAAVSARRPYHVGRRKKPRMF